MSVLTLTVLAERPESVIRSIEVVTPPDRRTGRKLKEISPSEYPILSILQQKENREKTHHYLRMRTIRSVSLPSSADLSSTGFDLGVVVSFGYFLPPHILHAFPKGVINVHPSLLPKYRGAAPMQHTIMNGDVKTGVTVQELDEKVFDAGKILLQEEWKIPTDKPIMFDSLAGTLGLKGATLLVKTLCNYDIYKENATTQVTTQVTHAPKITKDMAFIDFETMPAETIERLHRAIGHQYPITTYYTLWRIKRSLKIKHKHISMQLFNIYLPIKSPAHIAVPFPDPGTIFWDFDTKTMHVVCADGNVIGLTHIKAESRKEIPAYDFFNGYSVRSGDGRFGAFDDESEIEPGKSGEEDEESGDKGKARGKT
ncbi:formyl transferase [Jimgerdemannia flammicorona]|uniref:methionyl-tRNA formyltransferase n=1 Tax=Jimgerdemannia flammicorona TaxID=994334 RepID=A0A433QUZ4_9FUNG|nr:formyl transferase [Jimgerdemannia flammicorona]